MTPQEAYNKALQRGKRMPELKPVISKDAYYSYLYAKYVIEGRFILGEPAISKNAEYSYWYAINVIKSRLPDFMHNQMILGNNEYTKLYIKYIKCIKCIK